MKKIIKKIPGMGKKAKDVGVEGAKTAVGMAVKGATNVAEKTQDVFSRRSADDEVREHILLQARYNDILAMKLDEALKRIEALEKRLEAK